ncbi:MAG: hypothetical protein ACF8QF_13650 [Phycisphaerales bacterium]
MHRIVTGFVLAALALTGCSEEASPEATAQGEASPSWTLASAPEGAVGVVEVRAAAQEGDSVVIRGRIGGRAEPISDGSPVFTIMDLSLAYCGQASDDGCTTPWDYCCETPEAIAAHAATVQVIGIEGGALTGLAALDEVVVVGTVGPRPTPAVLTIIATGVHRVGG